MHVGFHSTIQVYQLMGHTFELYQISFLDRQLSLPPTHILNQPSFKYDLKEERPSSLLFLKV